MFVRYENVKHNMQAELMRICKFLNVTVPPERWSCVLENSRGNFKRNYDQKSKEIIAKYAVFPEKIKEELLKDMIEVDEAVANFEMSQQNQSS